MQQLIAAVSEFSKVASWLALTFSLVALLISVIYIAFSARDLGVKLVGSIFVVSLCFAANNAFVYPLGILIVATLVTELEFLEKIAALLWNRKEYWDYLIGRASRKEIEQKIRDDVAKDKPAVAPRSDFIQHAIAFERSALNALIDANVPLKLNRLDTELRLQGRGRATVIDGLGYSDDAVYLIEVKATKHIRNLGDTAYQLDRYAQLYADYLHNIGGTTTIRKILIVPEGSTDRNSVSDAAILRFDLGNREFTNFEEVVKEFPTWNWKRA
jgi:hypothetical protein